MATQDPLPPVARRYNTASSTSNTSPGQAPRSRRVLACIECAARKVKCDRNFPCANCIKASKRCVPSTLTPRKRRRKVAERDLVDRLHQYEGLLRQHGIDYEPLQHSGPAEPSLGPGNERTSSQTSAPNAETGKDTSEAVSFWRATEHLARGQQDDPDNDHSDLDEGDDDEYADDDLREVNVKKTLNLLFGTNDDILFGSRRTDIELSTLHPSYIQILGLWQIYLDRVNPVLKVTHTSTLQARIIEASADVTRLDPTLEALMFSIYAIAIMSMEDAECQTSFASSKQGLTARYHFGCQQALLNAGLLRSSDRDSLTAFYLYLISIRPTTDPRSLNSLFSIALRIAQQLSLHVEAANTRHSPFEAEMRRRLWWSLVAFDHRLCEISDSKSTMLIPTWDCKTPLNISDADLNPDMTIQPVAHQVNTEAVFIVARSVFSDAMRNTSVHLSFVNPLLKPLAKPLVAPFDGKDEIIAIAELLETQILSKLATTSPIPFLTLHSTNLAITKARLMKYYAKYKSTSRHPSPYFDSPGDRDDALALTIQMLECDTQIISSDLTKQFQWFTVLIQFPFPAYVHIIQDLRKRPLNSLAERAWEKLSENYEARRLGDVEAGFLGMTGGSLRRDVGPLGTHTTSVPGSNDEASMQHSPGIGFGIVHEHEAAARQQQRQKQQQQQQIEPDSSPDEIQQDQQTRYANIFHRLFGRICLAAWRAREAALLEKGQVDTIPVPGIVVDIREKLDATGNTPSTSDVGGTVGMGSGLAGNLNPDTGMRKGEDMESSNVNIDAMNFNNTMPKSMPVPMPMSMPMPNIGFDYTYPGMGFEDFNFNFNMPFGSGFDAMSPGLDLFGQNQIPGPVAVALQGQRQGQGQREGQAQVQGQEHGSNSANAVSSAHGMDWVMGNFDNIGPGGV